MKVFAGVDFAPGSNSKQVNVVVAATSRAKAVELLRAADIGVSAGRIATHWGNGSPKEQAIALAAPGQVFVTESLRSGEYKPTGDAPAAAPAPAAPAAKLKTIKVTYNTWGNYCCFIGSTRETMSGESFRALDWLADKLATGLYKLSDKSHFSMAEVEQHRADLARPLRTAATGTSAAPTASKGFKIIGESTPAQDTAAMLLKLAKADMLDRLKDSEWYKTSPDGKRGVEPVIEITGIEQREVVTSMGILAMSKELRPFVMGRTVVNGIGAKLALNIAFGGAGGLTVLEGE